MAEVLKDRGKGILDFIIDAINPVKPAYAPDLNYEMMRADTGFSPVLDTIVAQDATPDVMLPPIDIEAYQPPMMQLPERSEYASVDLMPQQEAERRAMYNRLRGPGYQGIGRGEGTPQSASERQAIVDMVNKQTVRNQPQEAGLLSKIGGGLGSIINDPITAPYIMEILNQMRNQPNKFISQMNLKRIESARETEKTNRTADYLEKIGQKQAADFVRMGLPAKDVIGAGKQFDVGSGSEFAEKYGISGLEPTKPYKRNIQTGEVSQIGGGGTNVDINMKAETRYAEEVRKNFAESETKLYQTAVAAPAQLEKLYETRSLIEQGDPQTGAFAELSKNIQRVRSKLFDSETAQIKVADTELLNSLLGSDVFGMIGALGIGARGLDTPAEREFLREVMTGTISLNKETLLRMLDIRENVQRRAIQSYNDAVMGGELDDFFEASRKKKRTIDIPQYSPRPIFSQRQEQEIQSGGAQRIGNMIIRQVGQ